MRQQQWTDAEGYLKQALQEGARNAGKNRVWADRLWERLAKVYEKLGRTQEAVDAEQSRISAWEKQLGTDAVMVARCLGDLAGGQRRAGRVPDAEAHYRRAFD